MHEGGEAMRAIALILLAGLLLACSQTTPTRQAAHLRSDVALNAQILADPDLTAALALAKTTAGGGLNAGDNYPQVWVRDLATFIQLYLESGGDAAAVRRALLRFVDFQQPSGRIPDFYVVTGGPGAGLPGNYTSPLEPGWVAVSQNAVVESDEETSLVQAVATYVRLTQDSGLLSSTVAGQTVQARLDSALRWLVNNHTDSHGLVWMGACIDWGDEQAGTADPFWNSSSERALEIYPNAMLVLAIKALLAWPGVDATYWNGKLSNLQAQIPAVLWDGQKYRAHVHLDFFPYARGFLEWQVNVHGGTAEAALAGLLTAAQIQAQDALQDADVAAAGAPTIGLTVWPLYPPESFPGINFAAFQSQNGGDWDWFGARMVQALTSSGDLADAYRELKPMAARVNRVGAYYEWWGHDNSAQGSKNYRGAAGQMGLAIEQLRTAAGG